MNNKYKFRQTNAYAMQYGLAFGALWIVSFLMFVAGISFPAAQLVFLILVLATPILGGLLVLRFRKTACENTLTFNRGFLFSVLMYIYASFLMAAYIYIHFRFIDHGAFAQFYETTLSNPQVAGQMEAMLKGSVPKDFVDLIAKLTPADYAANVINTGWLFGIILSIPTAIFCRKTNN